EDSRLAEAIANAGNRILGMGRKYHRQKDYNAAKDYYVLLLEESLIANNIQAEVTIYYEQAVAGKPLMTATDMYEAVLNAGGASAAWKAGQDFKTMYPEDPRLAEAIASAGNRILGMGRKYHRQKDYVAAKDYYALLIDESLVAKDIQNEVTVYYEQAAAGSPLMTAIDMYEAVLNASGESAAWKAGQDFKKAYQEDTRLTEAIASAGN